MPSYSALIGGPAYGQVNMENVSEHVARMHAIDLPVQDGIRRRAQKTVKDVETAKSLQALLTPEVVWWTRYLGAVGRVLTKIYPAGVMDPQHRRVRIEADWARGFGKRKGTADARMPEYVLPLCPLELDAIDMKTSARNAVELNLY